MSLKGNLDPTFLSSLFQIYCDEKKTGLFTADCDGLQVEFYIREGVIVHATGIGQTHLLADILRHRGILPAEQVDQVEAAATRSGEHLCKTVLELGFMTEADLVPILKQLAADLLVCLFQQTRGEFEYTDQPVENDQMVMIRLEIRRAIFDAFRLLDELKELKKKLPDEDVRFSMEEMSRRNTSYQLDAVAWRILSLIHAKQPLKEIVRQSSYNAHVVYTTLLDLLDARMITFSADWEDNIHADETPAAQAQAPAAESKPKEKGLFGFFKKK